MSPANIADHTTTCPYCGHRVLPRNLADHVHRIHPDQAINERFSQKLRRTESEEWWDEARKNNPVTPLSDVYSEVVRDQLKLPKGKQRKKQKLEHNRPMPQNSTMCPVCSETVITQYLEIHQSQHEIGEPLKGPHRVHCPICQVSLDIIRIKTHFTLVHPSITSQQRRAYCRKAEREFYGFEDSQMVVTTHGTMEVSSKNYVKCPGCESYVKLNNLDQHLQKHKKK